MYESLSEITHIHNLAVLGAGYVGLPTAVLFADCGLTVTVIDIKNEIIANVNDGFSTINEPGLNELLSKNVKSRRLIAELLTNSHLANKNAFILTVQTPIDGSKKPDLSFLFNALSYVGKYLQKGSIVAVCSTLPPGTTCKKVKPLLESLSGLKADVDFYLAYVPERIAPGNALKESIENPRLVGGIGPNSTKVCSALFKKICKNVIETDAVTAEISKTAENTFRDINIAFANQLALICEQHQADILKVSALANTHPRVNIHSAGPGVGGPCLTKDPYLLTYGAAFRTPNLINISRDINNYMPHHMVELVLKGFDNLNKEIRKGKIAILGTSYKANVDDPRYSPAEPIIKELITLASQVKTYDPFCKVDFGAKMVHSSFEAAEGCDCLLIVTDHDEFKNLDLQIFKQLMNGSPIIVDGKRIINPLEAQEKGFAYYGVGFGNKNV